MKTILLHDVAELHARREQWLALLGRSGADEPTLSPDWLLAWWGVFGGGRKLRAAWFEEDGRVVGFAPLCARTWSYPPGIPFRRLELLASGEDEADEICSDYLGIVAERGREQAVADELAQTLAEGRLGPWDELVLPALSGDGIMPLCLAGAFALRGWHTELVQTGAAPYIPLPSTWDAYLAALSSQKRYLVRKSERDVEKWAKTEGGLRLEQAHDLAGLARGRKVLEELHGERWQGERTGGVFGSARFRAFHDQVMPALLATGALELVCMYAGDQPLAAVYNIVWNGRVHFYQSGRRLDLPRHLRLGIALHAHAIRAAIAAGRREYDFLNGTSRYKLDLALDQRPLLTLRAVRAPVREAARRLAVAVRARTRPAPAPAQSPAPHEAEAE